MKTLLRAFCLVLILAYPCIARADDSLTGKVDQLFAAWEKPDTPGCALAIIRDGKTLYQRGYGMASLEFEKPITPSTVFCLASVSKQFTAMCIYLLAQDGKLALDDDVRKYVPELHEFGKTITIRHLLHHASGLRDYFSPLELGGWGEPNDSFLQTDILTFAWRQKELNFAPGEKYDYSNTGYVLLGLIVQRASGKTLREFAAERIFQPLDMKHSQYRDDYQLVIKNRSTSYSQRGKEFREELLSWEGGGEGNLFSTIEDMAKWDQNFYDGKVGGSALLADMQQKGKLNNGKEIGYASGLEIRDYKGLRTVSHNGSVAGFRTIILRFPDQRFSVILLANVGSFDTSAMALKVADIYLEAPIKAAAVRANTGQTAQAVKRVPVKVDPKLLDKYTGKFMFSGFARTFVKVDDHLELKTGDTTIRLLPASDTLFFMEAFPTTYTFVRSKKGEVTQVIRESGDEHEIGERYALSSLAATQLKASTGTFFNEELDAFCMLTIQDGRLALRFLKASYPLFAINPELFIVDGSEGNIALHCHRDSKGRISELRIDWGERAQKMLFVRVDIKGKGMDARHPLYTTTYHGAKGNTEDWSDWLPPADLNALKEIPATARAQMETLKQHLADIAAGKHEVEGVRPELLRALDTAGEASLKDLLKELKSFTLVLDQDVRTRDMAAFGVPFSRILIYRVVNAKGTKYLLVSQTEDNRIVDINLREE